MNTDGSRKTGKSPEPQEAEPAERCCDLEQQDNMNRRHFVKLAALSGAGVGLPGTPPFATTMGRSASAQGKDAWPFLRFYDRDQLSRIALPLGGIGTGTVSLGGNGNLRDWELMNRPAKGFVPRRGEIGPFFALYVEDDSGHKACRALEGPVEPQDYEGSHGSTAPNENLPRFQDCSFAAAYPLGRVMLSDPEVPVEVRLRAFNPLVPGNPDDSGIPLAVLTYEIQNTTTSPLTASICGSLPNFIGVDGWETTRDWKGDRVPAGAVKNRNQFRSVAGLRGIYMTSDGVDAAASTWGTMALATTASKGLTFRTDWERGRWGNDILDFWDDFSADGKLEHRPSTDSDMPVGSVAVRTRLSANETRKVRFLLAWHFPNRYTWTPEEQPPGQADWIGNYYATRYQNAWDVLEKTAPRLLELESATLLFVRSFCESDMAEEVKEAALFNISTLRTQTCFRTADGQFFGWEGTANQRGCCHGSCTHVWNYEQATAHLFGTLAMSMREVEFEHATNEMGMMSFRVHLPLGRAQAFARAAADGQMGCIMKMYRDWQLSGDGATLRRLWPRVRKALEFCWIENGWDGDRDGVMEGCQHNTMDVEYYGPNPQMGIWYLGALRAAEEMARYLGEDEFAAECRTLFSRGSRWIDENLFNGEYYEQQILAPEDFSKIPPSLRAGMGARDAKQPEFQLGQGCLVDQLVGQFLAHVCGLGYLVKKENVAKTLRSVLQYNQRNGLNSHFNSMRSFALGPESGLLMADYPTRRPENPFPYFTEVMTGFEYTAAVGMLYEGLEQEGLACIRQIRARYDGKKRSPFDEAECGHHYARAMASWAAVLAVTGFRFSAVTGEMTFAPHTGTFFWSNGYAWGTCSLVARERQCEVQLICLLGTIELKQFTLGGFGTKRFPEGATLGPGKRLEFEVTAS